MQLTNLGPQVAASLILVINSAFSSSPRTDKMNCVVENGVASTVDRVISIPSQPGDPVFYSNSFSLTPERYEVCLMLLIYRSRTLC